MNLFNQRKTVHLRHDAIDDYQSEIRLCLCPLTKHGKCHRTAGGQCWFHAPHFQHFIENASIRGVIINHQHVHVLQMGDVHLVVLFWLDCSNAEIDGKVERTSASDFTLNPDPPSHQLDELCRDCESQSRPAILTIGRAIPLGELFKNRLQFLFGNSNTGIGDFEVQNGVVAPDWFRRDFNSNFARSRKL